MAIGAQYTFGSLVSNRDPAFEEFYQIYTESISLREQKPKEQISALVSRQDYKIFLLNKDHSVIGFSILFVPSQESFFLLEYMAIHPAYRNKGLGRDLFLQSLKTIISTSKARYCLLEVDSEREESDDRETRKRREHFYRRLGCRRVDSLPYLLPLPGEGQPPEMDLMVYLPDLSPQISRLQLEHWLQVIYSRVYDCSPNDPRIAQMMAAIGEPVNLV